MCLCKIQQMNERRAMKEDMETKLYKCSTVNNPVNPRCGVIFNNNSTQPRFQLGIRKDFSFSLLWLQSMFKTVSKTLTISKVSTSQKSRYVSAPKGSGFWVAWSTFPRCYELNPCSKTESKIVWFRTSKKSRLISASGGFRLLGCLNHVSSLLWT